MLRWIGEEKGLAGFVGIPTRDLSKEEIKENAERWAMILGVKEPQVVKALIQSGAYEPFRKEGDE